MSAAIVESMEGGFGFPLGGDPEELMRSLQEFAARQAESVAEAVGLVSAARQGFMREG